MVDFPKPMRGLLYNHITDDLLRPSPARIGPKIILKPSRCNILNFIFHQKACSAFLASDNMMELFTVLQTNAEDIGLMLGPPPPYGGKENQPRRSIQLIATTTVYSPLNRVPGASGPCPTLI